MIQRNKLHSAYQNINWGEGVKSHALEIAQDVVDRQKERYAEYKKDYSDLGELVNEVSARDSEEALKETIASRDELLQAHRKWGAGSMQYLTAQAKLAAKHKEMSQRSKMSDQNFLEAAALLKSDPNIRQSEARKLLEEEAKKPLLQRNMNLPSEMLRNPTIYNVDSYTKGQLDKYAPVTSYDYVTSDPEKIVTNKLLYRDGVVTVDQKNPTGSKVNIPDSLVDQIYNSNPDLFNAEIDLASKARAGRVDEQTGQPIGDVIQNLKDQGAGDDAIQTARKAMLKAKLASTQDMLPKNSIVKVDEKSLPWSYTRTAGGVAAAQKEESINNIAKMIEAKDEKSLQALFTETGDGLSLVRFNGKGDLIVLRKLKPGTKLREKGAARKEVAQVLGITEEELAARPDLKDLFVAGNYEAGSDVSSASGAIHKDIKEPLVKYGKQTSTTSGKKKSPMKK